MICQSVVVKVASHVCRSGPSAPVVGATCANQALLPPSALYFIVTGADYGFLPPSLDPRVQIRPFRPRHPFISLPRVQIVGFAPVGFNECCPRTAARARSAQGASQAEFLREGIFRCRAGVGRQGKLCGDGKPAGPDVPP